MERVISGVIAIPIALGIILYGHPGLFFFLIASIVLIAAHEYFSMIANAGVSGFPIEGLVLSFLLLATWFFIPQFLSLFGIFIPLTLFIVWCFREKNVRVALDSISYTLFGILYTAGLGGYFLLISNLEGGRQMIVFILLFVWAGDSAAFYIGRKLGERKLLEVVSPNKTIAGAIANVMGTLIAALLASNLFFDEIPLIHCLIVAFICGIIGQFGDLAESLIKRNCQVKDSGTLIPGHGGVLDRIDSLLFVGPAFYCYYQVFLTA
ncbi:phosphatidate cytidylyltransferase [bacterium AH-315-C08]|nr:phosphatidate cytidylyltransferase [bacterium AH-315-C08]